MKNDYRNKRDLHKQTIEQIDAQYGKLPPQAVEVEEAVLGAAMLERDAIYKLLPIIHKETFYKDEHQKIFNAIEELASAGRTIDLLQVTQYLKDCSLLEEVGGPGYITQLTSRVSAATNIEHHARIIAEKHMQREIIRRCSELVAQAYVDDFDELTAMYNMHTQAIDDMLAGKSGMMHIRHIAEQTELALNERIELAKQGVVPGVTTGLYDLNELNSGWQRGDLIVIGARPSMGKTALAINLFSKAAAEKKKNVCIFSLEMENIQLSSRLILSYGGIIRENYERGAMSPGDWEAFNKAKTELSRLNIWIDDTAGVTQRYIDAVVRNKVRRGECDLVVIDYLQLVETPEAYGNKNREREVAEISRALKKTARAAGVPIILLVQLNRAIENREDKTPHMADIRESGAIEQDADIIIFPWRPCYYDPDATTDDGTPLTNVMLLEIAKYRNGRTCTIPVKHSDDLTQFEDFNVKQFKEPF